MRHRVETCGWHACAGRVKHVVDVDLTVTRSGPYDDGAGTAADPPGDRRSESTPLKEITIRHHSCGEALSQNAERVGKARRLRKYPS